MIVSKIPPGHKNKMVDKNTQDRVEQIKGALELDILYWEEFFHLPQDQRPDAIQLMVDNNILTTEESGNYQVQSGIRKINTAAGNLEHGQDRDPLYFKDEAKANTLVEFYKSRNQQVSIKRMPNHQPEQNSHTSHTYKT